MAKKENGDVKEAETAAPMQPPAPGSEAEFFEKLPPEVKQKLTDIKNKLDKFKDELLKKFDKYVIGIALLPPPKPPAANLPPDLLAEEQKKYEQEKDRINVMVLVDDTDSQKMSKDELAEKMSTIVNAAAQDVDKNITPQITLLSDLWQNCYDGKYDLLELISLSAPIHDTGMLSAVKIAEIHKQMVLKKFEKYIVAYVLAGSLVQGRATKESDIDVFIVIDDTDVKKMTRVELKDKLRAIIIGMGIEAGELTNIRNKINIQVYILTDFWEMIKEANPIIFTFLRDGVPFYDRGIFMPWKQLLRMGKIRPSGEAIEMYMSSGEQILRRVQAKINEIGMEDLFYAILTPSQAAIMMYGLPPPTPRETPEVLREIFVKKEKMFTEDDVKTLEKVIKLRKDLEHGTIKDVSGKDIDELLKACDKYLHKIKELFKDIESMREKDTMLQIYDSMVVIVRDILRLEGVEKAKDTELMKYFESALVEQGKVPEKYLRILDLVVKGKKDYDTGKLTKTEVEKIRKDATDLIRFLVEYLQRKRGRELERLKIRVKHGDKIGEVTLLGDAAFIVHDIEQPEKTVSKALIKPDGSLGEPKSSSLDELEKYVAKVELPQKPSIKPMLFESLKRVFGRDVEIVPNY